MGVNELDCGYHSGVWYGIIHLLCLYEWKDFINVPSFKFAKSILGVGCQRELCASV